ncbi:MAG: hypothetical protein J6A01_09735 [Proteobacteria bacterium]|nr:hypothetical protein [Pseudomonadota bacterium]
MNKENEVRAIPLILVLLFVCQAGCSTAKHAQKAERNPVSLVLEVDQNAEVWQQTARGVSSSIPEYEIAVEPSGRDARAFNHIESSEQGTRVCFEPQVNYDFAGNLTGFTPIYCAAIDETATQQALIEAVDQYQSRFIPFQTELTESQYRASILSHSSPDDPLCYSVYPGLFAAGTAQPLQLEENYMLACANAIEGEAAWPNADAKLLAARLRTEAAMLSNQNAFIASVFSAIAKDDTLEGNIYGISLEGYTELLSKKLLQSEITTLEALRQSDGAKLYNLSKLNALRLFFIASRSDDMGVERLQTIIRALSPQENWPNSVADTRSMLQLRTCQMLTSLPEMTPSLVDDCLPWLRTMTRTADDFEMALRIVEQGIYGAKTGETPISSDVLSWLRFAPLFGELIELRHVFGQRNAHHETLPPEDRAILLGF